MSKDKTTSQIARKLDLMVSLLPEFGNDRKRVIALAKEQAAIMIEELVCTLSAIDLRRAADFGYLSSCIRTDLADSLHKSFGFETDAKFISKKTMKKLLKGPKER